MLFVCKTLQIDVLSHNSSAGLNYVPLHLGSEFLREQNQILTYSSSSHS